MPDYGTSDDHVTALPVPRSVLTFSRLGTVHCTMRDDAAQTGPEGTSYLQEEVAVACMSPTLLPSAFLLADRRERSGLVYRWVHWMC